MRVVGIVPAAGWATRLNLSEGSKEMLTVMGKPVMDHVIERMQIAAPDSIRVVTRPAKLDVIRHSRELGLEVTLAETRSVNESIAVAVEGLEPDDMVLIGFPDSIWEPLNGYRLLLDRLSPERTVVLGLFIWSEANRGDVVVMDASGTVHEIVPKPTVPSSNLIWGCAVATAGVLDGIQRFEHPGQYFAALSPTRSVGGVHLSDRYIDIGTLDALAAARAAKS